MYQFSFADSPLSPPEIKVFMNNKKTIIVESNPETNMTTAYSLQNEIKGKVLWEINGWYRSVKLADDEDICVIDLSGGLLNRNFNKKESIILIYSKGILIKSITVENLLFNILDLDRTASHYHWGNIVNVNGQYINIITVDSKVEISKDSWEIKKEELSEYDRSVYGIKNKTSIDKFVNFVMLVFK
jgi:hypothetical protein